MYTSLNGKRAVITGGTRGIGLAIARRLSEEGAIVAIVSRSGLNGHGDNFRPSFEYQADVSDSEAVEQLVRSLLEDLKGVDFLINCAGITHAQLAMRDSPEAWLPVIQVNLIGTMLMTTSLLRTVVKSPQGRIINFGSVAGERANIGQSVYGASKAGVRHYTEVVAVEYARKLTCNVIVPGFIETDMTDSLSDGQKQQALEQVPARRFGRPEEVANLAAFLCSDQAEYINGSALCIDGALAAA